MASIAVGNAHGRQVRTRERPWKGRRRWPQRPFQGRGIGRFGPVALPPAIDSRWRCHRLL